MVWREISADDLYDLRNPLIVDVRSPCEYESERIPEAVNIPLLSNDERAIVGTVYKLEGDKAARLRAISIISPKITGIIHEILSLKQHLRPIVIHCWRGGLRSEAVCALLSVAGFDNYRLSGGYKAFRAMVLRDLSNRDNFAF